MGTEQMNFWSGQLLQEHAGPLNLVKEAKFRRLTSAGPGNEEAMYRLEKSV